MRGLFLLVIGLVFYCSFSFLIQSSLDSIQGAINRVQVSTR